MICTCYLAVLVIPYGSIKDEEFVPCSTLCVCVGGGHIKLKISPGSSTDLSVTRDPILKACIHSANHNKCLQVYVIVWFGRL